MSSLSFDAVAHIYDETRGYPEDAAHAIAQALDKRAEGTPQTRYLEVGVGTGRIALPVAALGRSYTGVDISEQMMERLYAKAQALGWQEETQAWGTLPDEETHGSVGVRRFTRAQPVASALRVVHADITALPFRTASFDAAIAFHIFHLVSNWEHALQEVMRVVRPGGVLLLCMDGIGTHGMTGNMNSRWRQIVKELGGDTQRPGAWEQDVAAWYAQRGMSVERDVACTWQKSYVPQAIYNSIANRSWSGSWDIPEDIFATSLERLHSWADEYYQGDLETPRMREHELIVYTIRFQVVQ